MRLTYLTSSNWRKAEWGSRPAPHWLASYAPCIDDLNSALTWAFAEGGDPVLGGKLAARSVPLWFQLSQVPAGMARFERALAGIEAGELRARLHLNAALGGLGMFDPSWIDRREAAWEATLELARTLGDAAYELKALRALYASRGSNGDFRAMWPIAEAFQAAAMLSHDPIDFVTAERLIAHVLHVQGCHSEARMHLDQLMARPECQMDAPQVVRYQFDHRAIVRMGLSKIQWLQGKPDKALAGIESTVAEAASLDYVLTLCTVLSEAALPVAYFCGDFVAVDRYAAMLRSLDTAAAKVAWQGYAECFEGAVAIRRGEISSGVRTMRNGIDLRRAPGKRWHLVFLLGLLADALAFAGMDQEALAVVDEALALGECTGVEWLRPELLRIQGEALVQQGSIDAALDCLQRAAALAQAHGALAWELRAATSLARLHRTQGMTGLARKVLTPVYERFTEGQLTFDLRQARELLESLG
jgi:tetratricopeptide (TPR) repeat protein